MNGQIEAIRLSKNSPVNSSFNRVWVVWIQKECFPLASKQCGSQTSFILSLANKAPFSEVFESGMVQKPLLSLCGQCGYHRAVWSVCMKPQLTNQLCCLPTKSPQSKLHQTKMMSLNWEWIKLVLSSQGLAGTKMYPQWLWLPIRKSGQRTESCEACQRKTAVFQQRKNHIVAREKHMVTIERASHRHGFQCLLNQHTVLHKFRIQQSVQYTCTNLVVTYSVPTVFDHWFLPVISDDSMGIFTHHIDGFDFYRIE